MRFSFLLYLQLSLLRSGGVAASVFNAHVYLQSCGTRVFTVDQIEPTTRYFVAHDVAPVASFMAYLSVANASRITSRTSCNIVHVQHIARTYSPLDQLTMMAISRQLVVRKQTIALVYKTRMSKPVTLDRSSSLDVDEIAYL